MADKSLSRRDLLRFRWGSAPATPPPAPARQLPVARTSYRPEPATTQNARPERLPLRPPGALPEASFLDACHRCGHCVEACPHQAIHPAAEGPDAGTPVIETRKAPCQLCEGLACTNVCPSGALTPLVDPRAVRMGTAVIDRGECLAYRGVPCRACVDVCPLPGVLRLAPGKRVFVPVAGTEDCVGCGMCDRFCPHPEAIRIVDDPGGQPSRVRIEPPPEG